MKVCVCGSSGWLKKALAFGAGAALCFVLYGPTAAQAGAPDDFPTDPSNPNAEVTQMDFVKWLVTLTGDTPLFDNLSTVGDYVYWAKKYKMKPKTGWHPTDPLSQQLLAEMLVDFYKIKSKKGKEIETLAREGIFIPDGDNMTWSDLVGLVDDAGFASRMNIFSHNTCSPITTKKHKVTIDKCTPPPPPVADQKHRKFKSFKEKKASKAKTH